MMSVDPRAKILSLADINTSLVLAVVGWANQ